MLHERKQELTVWCDVLTEPGEDWEEEIDKVIARIKQAKQAQQN